MLHRTNKDLDPVPRHQVRILKNIKPDNTSDANTTPVLRHGNLHPVSLQLVFPPTLQS